MTKQISTVCVIGAGTMGSGIAAQVANAGGRVLLLDIAAGEGSRNAVTEKALERIAKSDPPLLMKPGNIERIAIGNIEDDLAKVKGCDWIVANDVSPATGIMGGSENAVHLITADSREDWPRMGKAEVAAKLAARIAEALAG